jgi:transposase
VPVLYVGNDWAENHHDIEIEDEEGRRLARARVPEGLEGISRLHVLVAKHAPGEWADLPPEQVAARVVVGIETDRGPWVAALVAAGYKVYAINPQSAAQYRQRHSTLGAKSDAGDTHMLAEIVRLDRNHHRPIAGDSELAEAIKLLARAHQTAIWERTRQVLLVAVGAAGTLPSCDRGVRRLGGRRCVGVARPRAGPSSCREADPCAAWGDPA